MYICLSNWLLVKQAIKNIMFGVNVNYYRQFLAIFGTKLTFFLKQQCYDPIYA
jgi:hypothetical protein